MDTDHWLGRPLPRWYGVWPGGLPCALTVDPEGVLRREMLPLEVRTLEGECLIFQEHRADHDPHPN